jgi:hypothetical protein
MTECLKHDSVRNKSSFTKDGRKILLRFYERRRHFKASKQRPAQFAGARTQFVGLSPQAVNFSNIGLGFSRRKRGLP